MIVHLCARGREVPILQARVRFYKVCLVEHKGLIVHKFTSMMKAETDTAATNPKDYRSFNSFTHRTRVGTFANMPLPRHPYKIYLFCLFILCWI